MTLVEYRKILNLLLACLGLYLALQKLNSAWRAI